MKKQKKLLISTIIFISIILSSCQAFAVQYMKAEFTEEFLNYLELSDEEKANTIMPRSYNVAKTTATVKNPLKLATMARNSVLTDFNLKTFIPENLKIKDQMLTGSCWTFASLAALETNLALKDYNKRIAKNESNENATIYDFSERHMEYATSYTFKDGINTKGFKREVGSGGNSNLSIPYLTNGTGAIPESEMQFENNETKIKLSQIKGKTVATQVNDAVEFPKYSAIDNKTEIIQKMKNHIMNYGAIDTTIHGFSLFGTTCYNNQTASLNCTHVIDGETYEGHAVAIVGWDDTWEIKNFINRPTNPGAWIIKNSWGTEAVRYTLTKMKEIIFEDLPNECDANGWTAAEQVTDEFAKQKFSKAGYIIEGNEAVIYKGDKGFMYVSYEDYNIYLQQSGIIDAELINYENIYQYNEYGSNVTCGVDGTQKMYIASVFNKKTTGKEYLTHVSIEAPETYTCKVYVNPDGTEKSSKQDLLPVQLKAGESETFDAGYHTLEFAEPIKIESDNFLVVLEIQGTQPNLITALFEVNPKISMNKSTIWDNVTISQGTSFVSFGDTFGNTTWMDTSNLANLTQGYMVNADTTLKAFTTLKILENISIEGAPKTQYVVGQDFDPTGMGVKANYANGDKIDITDKVTIIGGEDLKIDQTEVTIIYEGKSVTQAIEVVENTVESIVVKTAPTNDEYWAGENFDVTGMTIEATYRDGTKQIVPVTNEMVKDGQTLKNNQTFITVEYEDKTVTQKITVKVNTVVELKITNKTNKETYVVGQDFNSSGMIVIAKYAKGEEISVTDYEVIDGTNLQKEQTIITVKYEGLTATYPITVLEKSITGVVLESAPTKNEYIQYKEELDLSGGKIKISYNDGTNETIDIMTSTEIVVSGFDKNVAGKQTITLTYMGYSVTFEVEVKELAKPTNSDFTNMQGNVTRVRGYSFTDINKEAYVIINVELSDIVKATENEGVKYYYYLSANASETNIANWVKIDSLKDTDKEADGRVAKRMANDAKGKLTFEINTLDISNYEEIEDAENLYLYIKEVATKNGFTSNAITHAIILAVENINIEEFVDGEKKIEINSEEIINPEPGEEIDNTLAGEKYHNAGKNVFFIILFIGICILGRIIYLKYKDIEIM